MEQVNSPWGFLPRGWRLSTIDEEKERLTDYVANGSFASLASNVHYKDTEDYAVLIRLVDFNNDFKGPFVYIDEHAYSFLSKSSLSGGEIIISNVGANVGTVFKCPNLPYKMSLAPNAITIKLKGDNDFYYYWFKSKIGQANIQALVTGSAQPKFNKTNFRSMYIPVPPLDVQRRIASILSSLDRKIELNNKINADLEEMAQAIFKNWFVDFEPFKDGKFMDSELGMIPEGWKVGCLGDIAEITSGKRPLKKSKDKTKELFIPLIGASDIMGFTSDVLYERPILVIGRVGTHGVVQRFQEKCWPSDNTLVIESSYYNYVYQLLKGIDYSAINRGSTQPLITQTDVKNTDVIIAPENVLKEYESITSTLFSKHRANSKESSRLSLLRDTLLPRLMSGEMEIPE